MVFHVFGRNATVTHGSQAHCSEMGLKVYKMCVAGFRNEVFCASKRVSYSAVVGVDMFGFGRM